jgi:AcrR family transcriptional regulator
MAMPDAGQISMRQMNADRTKASILKAARHLFASRSYAEVGVRDIAARAKVNPALISRYYDSKIKLFEAALEASLDVTLFTETKRACFGETITEAFCKSRPDAAALVPMLVFAAGDSAARESVLRILVQHVIKPLERFFGAPEAGERAAQLMVVVTGFFTYRVMLPLASLEGSPTAEMRRWLSRTLQEIVDRKV